MTQEIRKLVQDWWNIQHGYLRDEIRDALAWCGCQHPWSTPEDLLGVDLGKLRQLTEPAQAQTQLRNYEIARIAQALEMDLNLLQEEHSQAHLFEAEQFPQIDQRFDAVMSFFTGIFQKLRRIHLEKAGKYQPEIHLPLLETMDWYHFTDQEASLCPPFVLLLPAGEDYRKLNQTAYQLLSQGKPYKLFVFLGEIPVKMQEKGRNIALSLHPDVAFFALGMRFVYVLQGMQAHLFQLSPSLLQGLLSPRPSLFALYVGQFPELVLQSRSLPILRYDPDQGSGWPMGMDLSLNPDWQQTWIKGRLEPENPEEELTFCHYAWLRPELRGEFTPLPAGQDWVPLAEYLALPHEQRLEATPGLMAGGQILKPSKRLLQYALDKAQLWQSLQTILPANPTQEKLSLLRHSVASQSEEVQAKKEIHEERIREEAVAQAMAELSKKLLGLESLSINVGSQAVQIPLPNSQPYESAPATQTSPPGPWIESALCTACEECVKINKKIFAYNEKKQAYIKDPAGGSFKDLVKAAEKCSAKIIHPGQPLNPKEKDLEKWLKRAAVF